ncbi:hypothetical protein B4Q13_23535 [Lacticaseibacillus rhamnosus]
MAQRGNRDHRVVVQVSQLVDEGAQARLGGRVVGPGAPGVLGHRAGDRIVELDVQSAAQKYRALVKRLGIGVGSFFHLAEIFFEAHTIEAGLIQVLRGAHKCAGFAANGGAKGAEIAAGLGRRRQAHALGSGPLPPEEQTSALD